MITQDYPFVTVIMPIRNEADFIGRSLSAVLAQDYPHDLMEVLIADGMSDDDTRHIVQQVAHTVPDVSVSVIDNPGRIAPTGLNTALAHTRGEVIVRVDGHCVIPSHYVSCCVHYLRTTEADGVGGTIDTVSSTDMGNTISLAMSSKFGVGNVGFRTANDTWAFVDTIPFPAYTRSAVAHAGLYDVELVRNQDDEYNYRLRKLGFKLLLAPDIRSTYFSRSSLRSLWRQYFQYGIYKVRVLQKHPRQMQWRQFVPFAFVVSLGSSVVLGLLLKPLRFLAVLVAGAYALANLGASVTLARRHGWAHMRYLPAVFAILHISYGLGFAQGLIKFRRRWRDHG